MSLEKQSPCKVNLLLNILGKRPDGFHELETVFHPVRVFDHLSFARSGVGIQLTCSDPQLPTDDRNLVHRAATAFLQAAKVHDGVRIHLEKRIPMAAGLGGGSGNAATTLLGLNELFALPLTHDELHRIAATLGSDVNFFLQHKPALAIGRGEQVSSLEFFPALHGKAFILVHPGFGISTAWAYQQLANFPEALNGHAGRAQKLISHLQTGDAKQAGEEFYNSLEAPALKKFPVLALYQDFFREHGALAALMSGSGSTTFAIMENQAAGEAIVETFKSRFDQTCWMSVVPV
ncbi:MAG TPA: 4-(cytidine 5'-diphospho)-2-C-methyl-D-erythritol kinase [Verrucomicrobiae bacterium]|jgi:4-diphosphocytidyl-2-C-methyl-D-erythritol kinase|nr:4-(cytidine 5'-diphospho)-2-C-methyl-D-erythritol kinase [Verrucomicrobiae bacterium]